mmetsp:Transcript_27051/g.52211  ORF Transcript_27051/g.52211 Transcript_27051/m.52211 type:complete len:310 (+) Transcript_27051:2262-3191(+)
MLGKIYIEVLEGRELCKGEDLIPAWLSNPFSRQRWTFLYQISSGPNEQKAQLGIIHLAVACEYSAAERKRIERFIFFKKPTTNGLIEHLCEKVLENLKTLLENVIFGRLINSKTEQLLKPLQAVLVHWVDVCKLNNAEEQHCCSISNSPIRLTGFINANLCGLGNDLLFIDLLGHLLGVGDLINQCVIFQDVSRTLRQKPQDLIFDIFECFVHLSARHYQLSFLLLQIRSLFSHNNTKHLILQSCGRDGKVQQRDFDRSFRGVMWIRECSGQEKLESIVVRNCLVTEFDGKAGTILDLLLSKYRLKRWI